MQALFLDRDGTINLDTGYTYKATDLSLVPGIISLIQYFKSLSYKIVVVSNQSGIARGYYELGDWNNFNLELNSLLSSYDCKIDRFYCCPHMPGLNLEVPNCNCRKPAAGMFYSAEADLAINLTHSLMIGDKFSDVIAAKNAGLNRAYLLQDKYNNFQIKNIQFNWKIAESLEDILKIEKSFIDYQL